MKNAVFWGVTPCGSCKNRRFGRTDHRSVLRSLITVNVVSNSPILVTLMMEAIRSSETLVLTKSHTVSHSRRRHSSSLKCSSKSHNSFTHTYTISSSGQWCPVRLVERQFQSHKSKEIVKEEFEPEAD
jgi:hypothetical protein